jgi:WD40 repeat protein/tRNA A-37 threonylcarbamoyl transferase component Bud32
MKVNKMSDPEASEQRSEKEIFFEALDIKSPEERAAFLSGACGKNPAKRARVEALLADHFQTGAFMKRPAVEAEGATVTLESADAPDESVGQRLGRYKLLEKIGEGGRGVVYVAEQTEPVRRRVALKVIKLGMDTKAVVARFEAERQALAMMDHPNIAKVLDAGTTETGRPFFVMELVRGVRITDYCDQNNLSTKERLDLFIKVCQAIQHAHQKGIIHRDIKPSNILVTLHDGVPVPKVIDFGIAKATEGRLADATVYTQLHQFIGTPAYMSPEQAEMSGLDIDTRSDIYSLGVLLYELLAGSTPFDAKELMAAGIDAMRKTIREKEPPRPSTRFATLKGDDLTTAARRRSADTSKLLHQLKGDLDWIVMKCLEKDRTRRYETAIGLARDIERYLGSEPVVARPASGFYRFQKMVRRNKIVFAAAGAVVFALVAGLGLATRSYLRERAARAAEAVQRHVAEEQRKRAEDNAAIAQEQRTRAEKGETEKGRLLYLADMNLAQQAWEQDNVSRLGELLTETQAFPDRGFEWYYWQRQTHLALVTLRAQGSPITCLGFSHDGQRILAGSYDGRANLWDAASGRKLLTLGEGRSNTISGASMICSVAFSPDDRWFVSGGADTTAKVWETTSGRMLLTLNGHKAGITSVACSADGRRILAGSGDGTAKVWDSASGKELLTVNGHTGPISSVVFSPDGQRILAANTAGSATAWDASDGRELSAVGAKQGAVRSVAFSADGRRIATGGPDGTVKVREVATGDVKLVLNGQSSAISSVAFSQDGQRIATGGVDGTARLWDAASGRELVKFKGHINQIYTLAFTPDSKRIVTGCVDGTAKVWEAATDDEPASLNESNLRAVFPFAVAFSSDGQRSVTGNPNGTANVRNAASGRELITLQWPNHGIFSAAFSPDGRIVAGSSASSAKVWDAASGRELLTLNGNGSWVGSVAVSPNGQRIVTGSEDQTAKVWDAATGKELAILAGHTKGGGPGIDCAAFSPDSRRIVTGSSDWTARVWEAASGRALLSVNAGNPICSVAFSPDGQRIVTGSMDKTAKVWDEASGRELLTLSGHNEPVWSVAFSPDGRRILTGSGDRSAKVWDATSGRQLLTLKWHKGVVVAAFSPDGQRILTGSQDGTAKVWEAATKAQVAQWEAEEAATQR